MNLLLTFYKIKYYNYIFYFFYIKKNKIYNHKYFFFLFINFFFIKNNNIFFRLSYIYKLLFNFYSLYLRFSMLFKFFKYNYSIFPIKSSTFTVLRSPHIDKRSREQFKLVVYKKILHYPIFFNSFNFYILKKSFLFDYGISISIKFKFLNR